MLYESDLTSLAQQWEQRAKAPRTTGEYKDALMDCVYDLRCLIDKNFAEETLARESFEQQLVKDAFLFDMYNKKEPNFND